MNSGELFQLLSTMIWMEYEIHKIERKYVETALEEPLSKSRIKISILDRDIIKFFSSYGELEIDRAFFQQLCELSKKFLNQMVGIKEFDCRDFQPKYLALFLSIKLPALSKIETDYVNLEELQVYDDDGIHCLAECDKIRALEGKLNIDQKNPRISNSFRQTNSSRLNDNLQEVKVRRYPFKNEYIILYNNDLKIKDGAHRAASLLYLYGNICIPVRRLFFDWSLLFKKGYRFPFEEIQWKKKKGAVRIVLYGAGQVGKIFRQQVMQAEETIEISLWVDREFQRINSLEVQNPQKIKGTDYDYIVIAVANESIAEEIRKELIGMRVIESKIVWKTFLEYK